MKRILIIDDDPSIRKVFHRFLGKHGYEVETASNGKEGLGLLIERTYDVVITDIMMPEVDGLEVVMEIRKLGGDIPVIAISGGIRRATSLDVLPMARMLGACTVIYKPVELEKLLDVVQKVLAGDYCPDG